MCRENRIGHLGCAGLINLHMRAPEQCILYNVLYVHVVRGFCNLCIIRKIVCGLSFKRFFFFLYCMVLFCDGWIFFTESGLSAQNRTLSPRGIPLQCKLKVFICRGRLPQLRRIYSCEILRLCFAFLHLHILFWKTFDIKSNIYVCVSEFLFSENPQRVLLVPINTDSCA